MGVGRGGGGGEGGSTVGCQFAFCLSSNRACVSSAVHDGGKRESEGG